MKVNHPRLQAETQKNQELGYTIISKQNESIRSILKGRLSFTRQQKIQDLEIFIKTMKIFFLHTTTGIKKAMQGKGAGLTNHHFNLKVVGVMKLPHINLEVSGCALAYRSL